ncbi:MAG: hypothetical protein R6W06_11195, partial [Prochlorococcaceae cyanobacterium]
ATTTEIYGADSGPLLGLQATTDSRLGTITLVGDPSLVAIGEQYLRQLDLRQRQVALSVKILDVNLDNDTDINNSFAFRWGNNFIVNDNGQMLAAFGRNMPARSSDFNINAEPGQLNLETTSSNSGSAANSGNQFVLDRRSTNSLTDSQLNDLNNKLTSGTGTELVRSINPETGQTTVQVVPIDNNSSSVISNNLSSIQREISRVLGRSATITRGNSTSSDSSTSSSGARRINPALNYPTDNFFDFVRATVQSRSTKILASPTLVLQEGEQTSRPSNSDIGRKVPNEGKIKVGQSVITGYEIVSGTENSRNSCQPQFGVAGLELGAGVEKIDDNGFVTFYLQPRVAAAVGSERIEGCGPINILNERELQTGSVRVRDGQTLILTGVISDTDSQVVSKWPILGDIPLIGQFFRATGGSRRKSELVILVTPRIINDEEGGSYGYGYRPETPQARDFMGLR